MILSLICCILFATSFLNCCVSIAIYPRPTFLSLQNLSSASSRFNSFLSKLVTFNDKIASVSSNTIWRNFTNISRFDKNSPKSTDLDMQGLNQLQVSFLLIPALLLIIANLSIKLNFLLSKTLKSSSFFLSSYKSGVTNPKESYMKLIPNSIILLVKGSECM